MSIPNLLTIVRIGLTFLIVVFLFLPGTGPKLIALLGFLLAALTDWLDGIIARRAQQITAVGSLLDPIADKILVISLLTSFVCLRVIPAWMVAVIVLREVLITGIRLAWARGHVVISAAKEGKLKAMVQMATILVLLLLLVFRERPALASALEAVVPWCLWATLILTVSSGMQFFWRHRAHLLHAAPH